MRQYLRESHFAVLSSIATSGEYLRERARGGGMLGSTSGPFACDSGGNFLVLVACFWCGLSLSGDLRWHIQ